MHIRTLTPSEIVIEDVVSYNYLRGIVIRTGGTSGDILCKTGKAIDAYYKLHKVWNSYSYLLATKIRII